MRKALLTCFCLLACTSACKLDSRIENTGMTPEAQQCFVEGVVCDSGIPTSSTQPDATTPPPPDTAPVMTGQNQTPGTDPNTNVGGMSGGEVDASVTPPPPPKNPDGQSCAANTDCISGHCLHDICCSGGDCCRTAADCPMSSNDGEQAAACNEPSGCQGKRGEIRCENFLCVAIGDIPDDSACTAMHMAQDCSPYKPVFCNGATEQEAPPCPTSCTNDTACIDAAHCDPETNTCVMDVEDGGDCSENYDCASNHCDSNICCASGDCCRDASTCRAYNTLPTCVNLETCTGSQKVALCRRSQCTNQEMPNPQGCNLMPVERCGLYPDVFCMDGVRARCATSCRADTQCKPEAYCSQTPQGGVCERKLRDGEACTSNSQCENVCNHGFCCGDSNPDSYCCGTSDDCRMLERNECGPNPNTCDGRRITAECSTEHRCRTSSRADANACTERSIPCGAGYPGPASCPVGCGCDGDLDCAANYHCVKPGGSTRGTCQLEDTGMSGMGGPGMGGMPAMP